MGRRRIRRYVKDPWYGHMTEEEATQLADQIREAHLPDLELLNVLEGGIPPMPSYWYVHCLYSGPMKWYGDHGLRPDMTLDIASPYAWDSVKTIITEGQEPHS